MTKKAKRGRPRATDGGLRIRRSIPFTDEEWREVAKLAKATGLPLAEYVRRRSLRRRVPAAIRPAS